MPASRTCHHLRTMQLLAGFTLSLLMLAGCGGGGGGDGGGGGTPTPSTPVARFAYLANSGDDTISVFIANNTSGQLTHHGYALTGDGPNSLTIDPSGQFAYTTNTNSQDISLFLINSLSGELIPADCDLETGTVDNCTTIGGTPVDLTFDSDGRYAYVANQTTNTISIHLKDPIEGALSSALSVQPPIDVTLTGGLSPSKVLLHPTGSYLYVVQSGSDNLGIYDVSTTDGTLLEKSGSSPVASGGSSPTDMVITSDGMFAYTANSTSGHIGLFTIDANGLLVANGTPVATGLTPHALVLDSTEKWLYLLSREASGSVSVFEIQSDGSLLQINCNGTNLTCAVGSLPESITLDTTGQFLSVSNGADNTVSLFSIDQTSGELTRVGTLSARATPGALAYLSDPAEAVITPRFAYLINEVSSDISAYSINSTNGVLTSLGGLTATAGVPSAIAVAPQGAFTYVANRNTDNISVFSINQSNGALSEISGSPFDIETSPTGPQTGPQSIAIDPSGRFAYVAISTDVVAGYTIDSSTGALSLLSGSPYTAGDNPWSITVDPTGRFAYTTNLTTDDISAFSIDPLSGELTPIGTTPAGNGPVSIDIDPSGRFAYVANTAFVSGSGFFVSAFSIDPYTGMLSELSGSPYTAGNGPISIAVDPLGKYVYVANLTSNNVLTYSINQSSGELTSGNTISTGIDPQSITIDATGQFVYVANRTSNDISAYQIDGTSGALSTITGQAFTSSGNAPFAITTTSVVQ